MRRPTASTLRSAALCAAAAILVALTGFGVLGSGEAYAAAGTRPLTSSLALTAIPTEHQTRSSTPSAIVDAGGVGYFIAESGIPVLVGDCRGCGYQEYRHQLYRTDGTAEGTRLAAVLPSPIDPSSLHAVGARLYFMLLGTVGNPGALWTSDGTAAGTVPVGPVGIEIIGANADRVFFTETGTAAKTTQPAKVLTLAPGDAAPTVLWAGTLRIDGDDSPDRFTLRRSMTVTVDGTAYFTVPGSASGSVELWRTDGTPGGTRATGIGGAGAPVAVDGTTLWLEIGGRIVRSDGTPGGTMPAPDPYPAGAKVGESGPATAVTAGRLFFVDKDRREDGSAAYVWATDGTKLTQVSPNVAFKDGEGVPQLVALKERAIYLARDASGVPQLWSSDGSGGAEPAQLTHARKAIGAERISALAAVGGLAYFQMGSDLRVTDGTPAGTRTIYARSQLFTESSAGGFASVAGRTVFIGQDPIAGLEPWTTDGTTEGTHLLVDLNTNARGFSGFGAQVSPPLGDKVLFQRPGYTSSLWASDGTPAGTARVTDLPQSINAPMVRSGPHVYMRLQHWVDEDGRTELWRSDGTAAGTLSLTGSGMRHVDDITATPGGGVVFSGVDGDGGRRGLWASDGSPGSARLIAADPRPAKDRRSSRGTDGERLTPAGRFVYFQYSGARGDWRLRRTDGTAGGTRVVPGVRGRVAARAEIRGRLWFAQTTTRDGTQLWSTDGTAKGLRRETSVRRRAGGLGAVRTISQGPGRHVVFSTSARGRARLWSTTARGNGGATPIGQLAARPFHLGMVGRRLVFMVRARFANPEAWATDGTRTGTRRIRTIPGGDPSRGVVVGGVRYFQFEGGALEGIRPTLWRTDGTTRGTTRVKPRLGSTEAPFSGLLAATPTTLILSGGSTLASARG